MFKYCQTCKENVPWEDVCRICRKKISGLSPPPLLAEETAFYENLNLSFFCPGCGKMTLFQDKKTLLGLSSKFVCSLCGGALEEFSAIVEVPQLGECVFFKPYEMNCRRRAIAAGNHLETLLSDDTLDGLLAKKIQKQSSVWNAFQTQRLLIYELTDLDGDLYREKQELEFWRKKLKELDKEHETVLFSYCNSFGTEREALERYENVFSCIRSEAQFKHNQAADLTNRMEDGIKKLKECAYYCADSINEGKWLQAVSLNDRYFPDLSFKARLLYALARDREAFKTHERRDERGEIFVCAPMYPCDKCPDGKLVYVESEKAYKCNRCGHQNNVP